MKIDRYYRQLYFVHSGVQDKNRQVTISKLPYDSFTCTLGDSPCTGDILLTSRSEGRCTYLVSSLQMTLEKACSDTEIFLAASGSELGPLFKALPYNNLFPLKERSFRNIAIPLTCGVLTWGHFDLAHGYCSSFRI